MLLAEHPSPADLLFFGEGKLDPAAAARIEQHVSSCEICCQVLEEQAADSFVSRLRDAERLEPDKRTNGEKGTATDLTGQTLTEIADIPQELIDHPRYQVLGLIGQGGMGAVYKALHRRMDRMVALKVIHPDLLQKEAAVQRFQQEVRAAARLQHPNIVISHDADQAGPLHFLIMEHLEGRSLDAIIAEHGSLSVAAACDYVRQAALGLQHAHEQGMVHRDIKPHNLMLVGEHTVKILDFGLARRPEQDDSQEPRRSLRQRDRGRRGADAVLQGLGAARIDPGSNRSRPACKRAARAGEIKTPPFRPRRICRGGAGWPCLSLHPARPGSQRRPVGCRGRGVVPAGADRRRRRHGDRGLHRPGAGGGRACGGRAFRHLLPRLHPLLSPHGPGSLLRRQRPGKARPACADAPAALDGGLPASATGAGRDLAHTLVRVVTNKGVLEFEADDEDIEVTIKQQGKDPVVLVIDKKTKKTIELTASGGELVAQERPDGIRVKTSHFELTRGGRVVFEARTLLAERKAPAEGNADNALIQGTWIAVSGERAGKPLPAAELESAWLKFTGDKAEVMMGGVRDRGLFNLDPSKSPKQLIIEDTERKLWMRGIYKLEGDELTVCIGKAGVPTEFKTRPESSWTLVKLLRETATRPAPPSDFRPLFDGKGLNAWHAAPGNWTWAGDELVATGPNPYLPGQPLRTKDQFDNVELRLEYRFPGAMPHHAQVLLRASENGKSAVAVNLRHGEAGTITSLGETALRLAKTNRVEAPPKDGWHELRIVAQGEAVFFQIDGETHATARIDGARSGFLTLVADGKMRFKNIRLKALPAPKLEPVFSDDDLAGLDGDLPQWSWERIVGRKADGDLRILRGRVDDKTNMARLWTKETFDDFELEFQTRVPLGGDVRVLVRGQKEDFAKKSDMVGIHVRLDRANPKAWGQIDQLERGGWRRIWTARAAKAEEAVRIDEQNHVLIRCVDKRLTVEVNGVVVQDEVSEKLPKNGVVGLRCMAAPDFGFRNVRLRRLPSGAAPPVFQPLFNGKDFGGWRLERYPKTRNVKEDWPIQEEAIECFQGPGILRTERVYGDYILQTEFMFPQTHFEEDDALGRARLELLLHCEDPTAARPPHVKIGVHIDGECTIGPATETGLKHVKSRVLGKSLAVKEWHKLKVVCTKDAVELFINGQPMGKMKDHKPSKGTIALSPTGLPVLHRNIEIQELAPTRGTLVLQNPAAFAVLASFYRVEGERLELVEEFQLIPAGKERGFDLDIGDYEVRGRKLGGGDETAWVQRASVAGGEMRTARFLPDRKGD